MTQISLSDTLASVNTTLNSSADTLALLKTTRSTGGYTAVVAAVTKFAVVPGNEEAPFTVLIDESDEVTEQNCADTNAIAWNGIVYPVVSKERPTLAIIRLWQFHVERSGEAWA